MYKIIIADDERIIRQGLEKSIDWRALNFEVEKLFSDGQEVIEYLEYAMPDVIITDIKMKYVSGLEVAKYIYDNKLPCKVILLSGFKEFELAVQGIKYGVEDYILKPLDVEQLENILRKCESQLEREYLQKEKNGQEQEHRVKLRELLEERFFNDLVMGVVDNEESIRSSIAVLYPEMSEDRVKCLIASIRIEDFDLFLKEVWSYSCDQLEENINNFLKVYDRGYRFHLVYKAHDIIEVIGIDVGNRQINAEQAVSELIAELEQCFQFKAGENLLRSYDSIYDILRKEEILLETDFHTQHYQEKKKMIMSNLAIGNVITAQKIFHNLLKSMPHMYAKNYNDAVIDILSTIKTVVSEINYDLACALDSHINYRTLLAMKNMGELISYCDRIFDRIQLANQNQKIYDTDSIINRAKNYIRENIYTDISQEDVASQFFICASYLSRIFKKQTGESFTQYVTRVKMEKAVELLHDPQYKTYQVGEMLGYKTSRYFSRLFRAQMGMNPSEYRKEVLHLGSVYDGIGENEEVFL